MKNCKPPKCYPHDDWRHRKCTEFPINFTVTPGTKTFLNPGNVESLHQKARDILPVWLEGVQLNCRKNLRSNLMLKQSWTLSHNTPSGFRIGGTYYWKAVGNVLQTPLIDGDINPYTLSTNIYCLYHPISKLRLQSSVQTGPFPYAASAGDKNFSAEYIADTWTSTLNFYNPRSESGRMTLSFLRNVRPDFCLGGELLMEWFEGQKNIQPAIAARYSKSMFSLAATLSKDAVDVTCWRQIDPAIQLASSLVINQRTSKALGTICYQWQFKETIIRGMFDSDWSVGFTYTRKLENIAANFGFSLLFCIPNNKFCCGMKFDLDSNLQ